MLTEEEKALAKQGNPKVKRQNGPIGTLTWWHLDDL